MTTLDYATFYETQVRPRQRRRQILLALTTVALSVTPLACVGLLTFFV